MPFFWWLHATLIGPSCSMGYGLLLQCCGSKGLVHQQLALPRAYMVPCCHACRRLGAVAVCRCLPPGIYVCKWNVAAMQMAYKLLQCASCCSMLPVYVWVSAWTKGTNIGSLWAAHHQHFNDLATGRCLCYCTAHVTRPGCKRHTEALQPDEAVPDASFWHW